MRELAEKSAQIAQAICESMEGTGISSLLGGKYQIVRVRTGTRADNFFVRVDEEYQIWLETPKLSATHETANIYGDFFHLLSRPSAEDVFEFMEDLDSIKAELEAIKEKAKNAEKVAASFMASHTN
jgi:dissimilatory sulfite reductase (desulfoviridin) alpha/beta subunit